jgi:hypothetical protein
MNIEFSDEQADEFVVIHLRQVQREFKEALEHDNLHDDDRDWYIKANKDIQKVIEIFNE